MEAMIKEIVADNNRLRRELKHTRRESAKMKEEKGFGKGSIEPKLAITGRRGLPKG